ALVSYSLFRNHIITSPSPSPSVGARFRAIALVSYSLFRNHIITSPSPSPFVGEGFRVRGNVLSDW
ncbi:hypothetical protein, partial [Limnospira fusiformis]